MDGSEMAASLPMYDFAELVAAHDALWDVVRRELGDRGVAAPRRLTRDADVAVLWHEPRMLVTQACGWPFVTGLRRHAQVVGVFDYAVGIPGGWYRSELIARAGEHVALDGPGGSALALAVNDVASLSGWVSLAPMLPSTGGLWRGSVVETGSHAASVAAVSDGLADCALIDAVTLALLRLHRPAVTEGIVTVGTGPVVPCLPLIVRRDAPPELVPTMRAAIGAALDSAELTEALGCLLIVGFEPVGDDHYDALRRMTPPRRA